MHTKRQLVISSNLRSVNVELIRACVKLIWTVKMQSLKRQFLSYGRIQIYFGQIWDSSVVCYCLVPWTACCAEVAATLTSATPKIRNAESKKLRPASSAKNWTRSWTLFCLQPIGTAVWPHVMLRETGKCTSWLNDWGHTKPRRFEETAQGFYFSELLMIKVRIVSPLWFCKE